MHIFIDESGSLGSGGGRYFVISAVCTTTPKRLQNVAKRFCAKHILSEIKGAELKLPRRQKLINTIVKSADHDVVYIVLDKHNLENTALLGSNLLFNYLASFIFENIAKTTSDKKLILHFDNRTVRTNAKYSLPDYLRIKLIEYNVQKDMEIHFCESHMNRGIQIADVIANTIYHRYKYGTDALYKQLHVKKSIRFPYQQFGQ